MPGIVLTPEEHLFFDNRWRHELPYGFPYTRAQYLEAGKTVYADYPELYKILLGIK
jgi:hypothetical protein